MQSFTPQAHRLAALGVEPVFDRITRLAAHFFSAPMAVIHLVGSDQLFVKSGLGLNYSSISRGESFCAHTILGRDPLVVPDAARDPRFAELSLVRESPRVRFYAGMPLLLAGESAAATLAVMDNVPRAALTEAELAALCDLAALAKDELERRTTAHHYTERQSYELPEGIPGGLTAMVWATDSAGKCTLLNRFEWHLAGPAEANAHRREWVDVMEVDGQDSKADLTFECRVPGPSGEDRWVLEQARPRLHADGSFAGYTGLCVDITARKRTEEALRETQEWLSLAQNAAGIGLWDWDIVNDQAKCSDQLFRLYGMEPGSISTYQVWQERLHPDDREAQVEYHARVMRGEEGYDREFRCIWPDGSVHWLYTRAKVFRDEFGRAVRALGANIDISRFKEVEERRNQAEKELLASREQLRQLAAYVESAREQERIRLSREIHDEVGQLLTVLKMDLGAIDAAYRASVPKLLPGIIQRTSSMLKNLDTGMDAVRRMCSELRPAVLDHLGIAAALEWQLQDFQSRTGVRCASMGLPEHLPLDAAQSTAVFRIFQEILTNIARHAAATYVKVELESNAGWLTLRVTDNGRGFDPLHLEHPAALGMVGMRERALLMGGGIDFQSSPGAGTSVTLRIPLRGGAPM